MVSRTPSDIPDNSKGFTLMELIVVIAISMLVLYTVFTYVDPTRTRARARDSTRLSDISLIEHAVNEYFLDNSAYPDAANTIRKSNVLPAASANLMSAAGGWIAADMTSYTARLPIDPINDAQHHYAYKHSASGYELDAFMEYETDQMGTDNGNDPNMYEVGNDLNLIVAGE